MKYIIPQPTQVNAWIQFPTSRIAYCFAHKNFWVPAGLYKCPQSKQWYRLSGELGGSNPEIVADLPKLVPYTEYGSGIVAFSPLFPYRRSSPQWLKERHWLMNGAQGMWVVEAWNAKPLTCAESDPSKKYPEVEWDQHLIGSLLENVPTISSEKHPVWQRHLKRERKLQEERQQLWATTTQDINFDTPAPPPPIVLTREDFRRRAREFLRRM